MKRFILLVMMIMPFVAMAEVPGYTKLANKYNTAEGVTAITIDKNMIAMFAGDVDSEALDSVGKIDILLTEDATLAQNILKDAKSMAKKAKLEQTVSVNDEGSTVTIYMKSANDLVSDILLLIEDEGESGVVLISGEFTEEMVSEIVKIGQ